MPDTPPEAPTERCDVAVVGAGPAGLGAATRLRALGVERVLVLDREPRAGGIPRHCGHYPFGIRELRRVLRGPDYARRLVRAAQAGGVDLRTATTVVRIEPGPRLLLATADGVRTLAARRVLLATGVRETSRASRLIGGARPQGVVSTGALQGIVYLDRMRPFRRPVILGTELVSFSAILTCRQAGIRPRAMVEPGARVTARSATRLLPLLLGMPLLLGTRVEAVLGRERVEGVRLRDAAGRRRELECDGLVVSGGFLPEASLARLGHLAMDAGTGGPRVDQYGRCSDPAYFAAGNLLRPVETAGWSWREGLDAAERMAADLVGTLPPAASTLLARLGGDALRYLMPQAVALPDDGRGMRHLQLRVARPLRGELSATVNGEPRWRERIAALPERRLLLPLAPLAPLAPGDELRVELREES